SPTASPTRNHSPALPRAGVAASVKPCSNPSGLFTYHYVIADWGLRIAVFLISIRSPLAVSTLGMSGSSCSPYPAPASRNRNSAPPVPSDILPDASPDGLFDAALTRTSSGANVVRHR